jgi:hypothetical protein
MDLLSRGHRIHNVHSDIDFLTASSPDTPHRSAHILKFEDPVNSNFRLQVSPLTSFKQLNNVFCNTSRPS